MAVPKKRTSRRVRDQRRAHDFLVATAAIETCPDCGASKQRHHVCPSCGTYRGRKVFADNDEAVAAE
ncbi:MAG: ribosomal protein [Pseudomonadota bacterium]|jgi:large subunit ribosomal protein L32